MNTITENLKSNIEKSLGGRKGKIFIMDNHIITNENEDFYIILGDGDPNNNNHEVILRTKFINAKFNTITDIISNFNKVMKIIEKEITHCNLITDVYMCEDTPDIRDWKHEAVISNRIEIINSDYSKINIDPNMNMMNFSNSSGVGNNNLILLCEGVDKKIVDWENNVHLLIKYARNMNEKLVEYSKRNSYIDNNISYCIFPLKGVNCKNLYHFEIEKIGKETIVTDNLGVINRYFQNRIIR